MAISSSKQFRSVNPEGETVEAGTLGYLTVATIQIGEVVGAGMLTLPSSFRQLGWALGVFFLLFMGICNAYIGIILSQAKTLHPLLASYEDLVEVALTSRFLAKIANSILIIYSIFTMSSYLVGMIEAIEMAFFETNLCSSVWGVLVVVFMIVPVQVRDLTEARFLMWANMILICVTVVCSILYMLLHFDEHRASFAIVTEVIPSNMTWLDFFGGVSQIAFSYCAAYFYLEMMREMRDPSDFPKSLAVAIPFQTGVYLLVAVVGYLYDGQNSQDLITKMIDPRTSPGIFRVACVSLFFHLNISYLIFGTMCARKIHVIVHPNTLEDKSIKGKLVWLAITVSLLCIAYLIANIIPVFGSIVAIIGSSFIPTLGISIPVFCTIALRQQLQITTNLFEKVVLGSLFCLSVLLSLAGTGANIFSFVQLLNNADVAIFKCNKGSYLDELN